jgi:predicted ester cyclase
MLPAERSSSSLEEINQYWSYNHARVSNLEKIMSTQVDPSSHSKAEQLALQFFSRVWTPPHDLSAIDELMTEDYVITSGGNDVKGREAFKDWVREFQNHLLEARTENLDIFSNPADDRVVSRWRCTGKNNGMLGLPADGRSVSFTGVAIWTIRDGKLARCWVERSAWELYQELSEESA